MYKTIPDHSDQCLLGLYLIIYERKLCRKKKFLLIRAKKLVLSKQLLLKSDYIISANSFIPNFFSKTFYKILSLIRIENFN